MQKDKHMTSKYKKNNKDTVIQQTTVWIQEIYR